MPGGCIVVRSVCIVMPGASIVMPTEVGIHVCRHSGPRPITWMPTFVGMTVEAEAWRVE